MANDASNFFYWYRRYKVRAVDMNGFEQAMVESARGLGEGLVGGGIVRGYGVAVSGQVVTIDPGIAVGPTGYLGVINTASHVTVPSSGFGALPSRSLLVVRPTPTDTTFIPSPTAPLAQVPLNQLQQSTIALILGAASGTPDYPARQPNDVVICGLMIPGGASTLDASMLDFEVRDTVGTHSLLQKLQGHSDDRLRPYRAGPKSVGLKSSQTSGSGPRLFSYPNGTSPSLFPLASSLHVDTDTFVDPSTGAISGGDTTTAPFAVTVPTGSNSIILAIGLNTDDTLSFAYGTQGTFAQCLAAIEQKVTSGAGAIPNTGGVYPIAYAIVSSVAGVYSDCQVLDMRPVGGGGGGGGASPIFFDQILAMGNGVTTTFALPLKPKDATSVLPRLDGVVSNVADYTVNTAAPSITFAIAPAAGQVVSAFGVGTGPSSISGHAEAPAGLVNGVNTLFSLSVKPVDQNSCLLTLDGAVVDPTQWSLIQSAGTSFVQFGTAPALGQTVGLFCLINVIAAGTPPVVVPSASYRALGSRLAPVVVDPAVGIPTTSDTLQHWFVKGVSGMGAVPVTANPMIAPGIAVAQVVRLTVIGATDVPLFGATGSGVSQDGDWPNAAGPDLDGATITYSWDGAQWNEDNRR